MKKTNLSFSSMRDKKRKRKKDRRESNQQETAQNYHQAPYWLEKDALVHPTTNGRALLPLEDDASSFKMREHILYLDKRDFIFLK